MKIGDKVIIHPKYVPYPPSKHEGRIATVKEIGPLLIKVSIDDFPNCNRREIHNQFWYLPEELEVEE